jgi:hypothetical protein
LIPGFEKIVEDRIKKGQRDGKFDNLPKRGEKLEFEDDSHVPEEMRLAYKLLKNAGFIPPELIIRKEINSVTQLLGQEEDAKEKHLLLKKLNYLRLKLDLNCNSTALDVDDSYAKKIANKLSDIK